MQQAGEIIFFSPLQHYALLVGGIMLLSGRSISPEQLETAGNLLMHFVEMYDAYYGK